MNAVALNALFASGQPYQLIDVLPEEIHLARHIPGSVNICVYETTFLGRMTELAPALDAVIVVYGAGEASLDSRAATEKLRAAGYTNVMELGGGFPAWRDAGFPQADME